MSITSDFSKFKKIDAHSHIGTFGSPFNVHFNADLLLKQMEEFNIEKTILCSDGPHTNEETVAAFQAHPDKIIPLMWINCAEGKPAYDALEHYIRDEHFAGASFSPSLTATVPMIHVWIRWLRSVKSTENRYLSIPVIRPSPFRGRSDFWLSATRTSRSS